VHHQAMLTRSLFIRVIRGMINFQTPWKWGSWLATRSIHTQSWYPATWIGTIFSFPSPPNKLQRLPSSSQLTSFPPWFPQVKASSSSNSRLPWLQKSKSIVTRKSIRIVYLCLRNKLCTRKPLKKWSNLKRKIRAT
jgi:hypothetical protein